MPATRCRPLPPVLAVLAVLVGLLVPLLARAPSPAAAEEPLDYVALGDSYSSGTGTGRYVLDGTACLRSPRAYPSRIAARRGYALNFRACSGAVVDDVRTAQLGALDAGTDLVTLSVGGNDAGFAEVLTTCALPWWLGRCGRAVDDARAYLRGVLPARLDALYDDLRRAAPAAEVVVVGYPRLFADEDCHPLTFFSPTERRRLNQIADLADRVVADAAARAGFATADPRSRFAGHAVCTADPWLTNLSLDVVESFHPTGRGHRRGYTPAVAARLPAAPATAARPTARVVAPRAIARQQRRYADLDAGIEPAVVRVPDLGSRRARLAARRHGIDLDRWVRRHGG